LCIFRGTISTNNLSPTGYPAAESLFNGAHPSDKITLNFLTSANDSPSTITGGGSSSGTWTLDGYNVDFVAVEVPGFTKLFAIDPAASTGSWDTKDIPFLTGGGTADLETNILFFGEKTALPEPSTWAMLLTGLFGLGALMRRRSAIARA
jgi:hypothetical protein